MLHLFNKHNHGFTIPELIIAITVLTLLTPAVIFGLGNYYQDNITSLAKTTQDTDTRSGLNTISNDLRATTGFRASLSVASVTPLGSNNNATGNISWSYCGTSATSTTCDGTTTNNYATNRVLIAYMYATDGPIGNNQRMPVFINSGGSFDLSTVTPATFAYIYYVAPDTTNASQNNLYRRTIVDVNPTTNVFRNISPASGLWPCSTSNPTFTGCVTPYQKTTCASVSVRTYSSVCGASDAVLLYNVKSFWVDYYNATNQPIANYYTSNSTNAANAATDIQNNAESIQVTMTKIYTGSQSKTSTASIRIMAQ